MRNAVTESRLASHPRKYRAHNLRPVFDGLAASALLLATAYIGILITGWESNRAIRSQLGEWLTTSSQSLAGLVEADGLTSLARPEDQQTETYRQIYSRIHDFRRSNPVFRFAYTCRLKDDSVYFAVDGTAPGDADKDGVEDHSALMDPYPDASENLRKVLTQGGAGFDAKPYTDAWGTFQSGCAAILDRKSAIVGAACVDMDISSFKKRIAAVRRAQRLGLMLCILISAGIGILIFRLRKKQHSDREDILSLSRDLEDKNEALLRSKNMLVEAQRQASIGSWSFHTGSRFMEWSEEMFRIHGRTKEQGPHGFPGLLAATHPDDRAVHSRFAENVLTNPESSELTYRTILPDGSTRYLFVRAKPECGADGRVAIVFGITQDMTSWHAIEAELINARDQAEKSSTAKADFLAMMSHEIRTPLNGVLGMAHILKDSRLNEDQRSLLSTILDSGEHLLSLINDILDFSKIDAGHMEMESIPFDLNRLVRSICSNFEEKANAAGIGLEMRLGVEPGQTFIGDPGRIRQILFNLIGNSVKFTKSGYVRLIVAQSSDHPGCMTFRVEDTGIGMTETQVGQLFKPFLQADSSTSRKFGGTGLGLAITLKLVSLMQGTVKVESTAGTGSTFIVLVPMPAEKSKSPDGLPSGQAGSTSKTLPDLAGLRVLLVDDRKTSRQVVRRQLEGLKMQVFEADSALSAHSLIKELERKQIYPQAALLDWRMPVTDGIELCRSLRSNPKTAKLPLLLISYAAARGDAQIAREAGFDGFLVQPIASEILAGAIHLAREKESGRDLPLITQHLVLETGLTPAPQPECAAQNDPVIDGTSLSPKILLVEDNLVNQKVALRMLEKLGCRVTLAVDGIEALKYYHSETFDMILMDCMMPEMDGYESTRAIRAREKESGRKTNIVACTANVTDVEIRKCMDAGMDDYLSKPYKPERLKEMIDKWALAGMPRPEISAPPAA